MNTEGGFKETTDTASTKADRHQTVANTGLKETDATKQP